MTKAESMLETYKHKRMVNLLMTEVIIELNNRAVNHDNSKLMEPEAEIFAVYTEKLAGCTYGSEEYKTYLKEMKVALDHHYESNRHHPEHFEKGIEEMTLIDLVELICDWKAASLRHNDGDINVSITKNKDRFGYSEELEQIFRNTVKLFEK